MASIHYIHRTPNYNSHILHMMLQICLSDFSYKDHTRYYFKQKIEFITFYANMIISVLYKKVYIPLQETLIDYTVH